MAPPPGAEAYHGFPLVGQTRQGGWCLGAITDPFEADTPEGCTIGDLFVEAPDGRRAGLVWDVDPQGKPRVLRDDYFAGVRFVRDGLRPFLARYAAAIERAHPNAMIFIEGEPGSTEPLTAPEGTPVAKEAAAVLAAAKAGPALRDAAK